MKTVVGCSDGDVRLSGGRNGTEGRVEICIEGAWGTVCDDHWDNTDAQVVCNQLGFAQTGLYLHGPVYISTIILNVSIFLVYPGAVAIIYAFPGGTGAIHLDDLHCTGNESRLIDCPHSGVGVQNCGHYEDAGVRCIRACMIIIIIEKTSIFNITIMG